MVHINDSSSARRKTYLPKASFIEGPTAAAAVEGNVVSSFWFRFKNGGNVSAGTGNCSTPPLRLDSSSSSSSRAQKEVSSGSTTPLHPKNIENHILMGFVRERKLPEGGLCLAMYFSYSQMYFQNCICLQRTQDGVKGNTL